MHLVFLLAFVVGQEPDRRGEVALPVPVYQGTEADAPIPKELHFRNEGGSDGSGLCVIASVVINGAYQHVPGLELLKNSPLWLAAKRRPGGYYPGKLDKLVGEVMPGEPWVGYSDSDPAKLSIAMDTISRSGRPMGATMNTGALYHYAPIHHMISLVHYRTGELACVVDNNDPGLYHWMPATEFLKRLMDGGEGWVFSWSRLPLVVKLGVSLVIAAAALLLLAAAGLVFSAAIVVLLPPMEAT